MRLATYNMTMNCSSAFAVTKDEHWIVQGIGGKPDERWTVLNVYKTKSGQVTGFRVNIRKMERIEA